MTNVLALAILVASLVICLIAALLWTTERWKQAGIRERIAIAQRDRAINFACDLLEQRTQESIGQLHDALARNGRLHVVEPKGASLN